MKIKLIQPAMLPRPMDTKLKTRMSPVQAGDVRFNAISAIIAALILLKLILIDL